MPRPEETDDDFDSTLQAVELLAKANAAIDADLTADDDDAETRQAAAAPIAADPGDDEDDDEDDVAIGKGELPEHVMDAGPLVEALLEANNRMAKGQAALLKEVRAVRRDQGVLAKANALLLGQNRQLREEIGGQGVGRRSVVARSAPPLAKSAPVGAGAELRGDELMKKAAPLLTGQEVSQLNEWINMGAGLDAIRAQDPALGARVTAAIAG